MERDDDLISVLAIIAALNEEEGIGPTLAELREFLADSRFLVIDGKSMDKTVQIAKDMGAKVIIQTGLGKGDAIACAIKNVNLDIEYVVFIDADFTYPAKYLPEMIKILQKNPEVGMVIGNRFNDHFRLDAIKNPFFVGNRFLALCQRFLNGVDLSDPLTGLRVVRWKILKDWEPESKRFDIEVEMNYHVEKQGYEIVEIPIHFRRRLGQKKLTLKDGFAIFRRILSEFLKNHFHDRAGRKKALAIFGG